MQITNTIEGTSVAINLPILNYLLTYYQGQRTREEGKTHSLLRERKRKKREKGGGGGGLAVCSCAQAKRYTHYTRVKNMGPRQLFFPCLTTVNLYCRSVLKSSTSPPHPKPITGPLCRLWLCSCFYWTVASFLGMCLWVCA